MTEPKDLQDEFVASLKALMVRYNVHISMWEDYENCKNYSFEDNFGKIDVSIDDLYLKNE